METLLFLDGNQQALALDKIVRKKTGDSPLELAEVQLEAPTKRQLLTPTQLGEKCDGISGRQVARPYPAAWRGFVYVLAILCVFRYVAEK